MLSRRVITRSGRHFRGRYPSAKLGRMVEFESLIERDVILLLEFSGGVSFYQEQPTRLLYSDGETVRDYFPDFEVHLRTGCRIHIEAKPLAKLGLPSVAGKLNSIAEHYAAHREEYFQVVTDAIARREPLHTNLRALSALRAKATGPNYVECPAHPVRASWNALETVLGRQGLMQLVARGHLVCDLSQPLEGELVVQTVKEADDDSLYI
ncbi:MAG: hypothetical protein K0S02_4945 [Achromobacter mucicolens]|uniref:hypothetical protein n=1 Tax=Achromobacter mucicolens TaxID=1389922 RepID=UPI00242EF2D6|nr:hypothetical protein [Achromobacter mucicolens]MDF2864673.1 hypothetical protein [Achromobacter mucicolens]